MPTRKSIVWYALAAGILPLAFFAASIASPDSAWAKHKAKPAPTNADPCAEPTAFVKDHIQKIRAAQAAASQHTSTVFGIFSSGSQGDANAVAKVSDLRHDADGVNDLLRAGGCTPIDIDKELKAASAAPAAPAQVQKKHKRQ